jgi:RNA polymerase sigma factor (sigma-70 family)
MHDWHEIRQRYGPLVWSTVYRIVKRHDQALDCYQDVFLEAIERIEERPVKNWPALLRWLAVRRSLDRLRKERRAAAHIDSFDEGALHSDGLEPSSDAEFEELVERVRLEMARLPDRQAEAFWLRCVEEISYAEIAKQMELDVSAVGVLIHRARNRLRDLLTDLNPTRVKD